MKKVLFLTICFLMAISSFAQESQHLEFKEISSYLMVNRICGDVNAEKDRIKEMFLDRYEFNL